MSYAKLARAGGSARWGFNRQGGRGWGGGAGRVSGVYVVEGEVSPATKLQPARSHFVAHHWGPSAPTTSAVRANTGIEDYPRGPIEPPAPSPPLVWRYIRPLLCAHSR